MALLRSSSDADAAALECGNEGGIRGFAPAHGSSCVKSRTRDPDTERATYTGKRIMLVAGTAPRIRYTIFPIDLSCRAFTSPRFSADFQSFSRMSLKTFTNGCCHTAHGAPTGGLMSTSLMQYHIYYRARTCGARHRVGELLPREQSV